MFARFDENPTMTLRRTDNVKTVYPLQTKFAGGIKSDKSAKLWPQNRGRGHESALNLLLDGIKVLSHP